MRLKARAVLTALLALAVAAPVVATTIRFPDVPQDHPNSEAIHWTKEQGLFKGYPDGRFQPDRNLSENEFQIVVKRLFDRYDAWTRAETAEFLHAGDKALKTAPPTTTLPVATTTATATTTTTTTTAAVPRAVHDAHLKVALVHDADSNFIIHWVRPGWEAQGWKWRVWSHDPRCGFSGGAGDWQTSRVGRGYANFLLDDGGLCVQAGHLPWQIEIVWDNGQRFVSQACVSTGSHSYTRYTLWNCGTPTDWRDWPNYADIPPTVAVAAVKPYSVLLGVSTFDVTLNVSRRTYLYTEFCGLKRAVQWVDAGATDVRLMCNPGQQKRLVVRPGFNDPPVVNQFIDVPGGNKTGLAANRIEPQVQVSVTIPDYSPDRFDIDVEVIVGAVAVSRGATVTYYSNSGTWGTDLDGNQLLHWSQMVAGSDRFTRRISTSVIHEGTIYYFQIHEPGAPTQYLQYAFPEGRTI